MRGPLPISVVVPAYDAQTTLAAAIESVRAQSAPPREIIVVDDGSRDGTAEVARTLGVTLLAQRNAGCGAARNAGIRHATQPWIALLDADDRWAPEKLAAQWDALATTGDDLCATDFAFVHADGTRSAGGATANRGYRRLHGTEPAIDVAHFSRGAVAIALPSGMFLLPSTLLFRRSVVMENSEWFMERSELVPTEHHYLPEDFEWSLRILRWTDVTLVTRSLVEYAVGAAGLSANAGQMRYGDAKLGELVCLRPARYADGAAAEMRRLRPARLREASLEFLRRLEFDSASVVAREAFYDRRRPLNGLLWAFALTMDWPAGRTLARSARSLWRRSKAASAPARPASR